MRKAFLPLLSAGSSVCGMAAVVIQVPNDPLFDPKQLTGTWEGKDGKGVTGAFQFQPGGYAQVTVNGERLVPEIPNGPSVKFVLNQSKSPIWLDFIVFDPSGKEIGRMKCIIQLLGPKSMKIRIGENPSTRPLTFDGANADDTLILKKAY